jgi:L-lactate dehydrogenase complex protein LldG
MTRDPVATFEASLDRLDVGRTRVGPADLDAALAAVVREPVVGARLPFPGVDRPSSVPVDPTVAELRDATTAVTPASLAVADYGSVVLPSTPDGSEPLSVYADLHVPVVRASDVVPGMPEAFAELGPRLRADRGDVVFATGPSATADMGALVRGAHGPREVHVVIVEDREGVAAPGVEARTADAEVPDPDPDPDPEADVEEAVADGGLVEGPDATGPAGGNRR